MHSTKWICYAFYGIILIQIGSFSATTDEEKIYIDVSSDSSGKVVILSPNSSVVVHALNFGSDVTSIMFGAHAQNSNITLSYSEQPLLHSSVTGKSVGLTFILKDNDSDAHMWLISGNNHNISVLIKLVPYTAEDPVPGGCNMEFPVEIAPYLRLIDDQFSTLLEFQHANIGSPKDIDPPTCSSTVDAISYEIYVFFLREYSYAEDEYFKGLVDMSSIPFLHSQAKKIHTHVQHPETRAEFLKYPKTGAIYNIIAKYSIDSTVREASYVPAATYGCILISEDLGCGLPYSSATRPLLLAVSMFGVFVAFFGHKYFSAEMFFFGFLVSIFVSFILISKYDRLWTEQSTLAFSITLGVLGGLLWMFVWHIVFRPMILVVPVGLVLGFLLMATVLYTPIGNHEMFMNDKIYWMFISGGAMIVTVLLMTSPKGLSIIGSSVVGSYTAVLIWDNYLGSSLIFIAINVVKRALGNHSIFAAINDFPFQTSNIIVSALWVVMTLLSVAVQTYMNWKKPYFPTPMCTCLKVRYPGCTCSSRVHSQQQCGIEQGNPAWPLLSENMNQPTYNSINVSTRYVSK